MKYIVTKGNPVLKEGIDIDEIIDASSTSYFVECKILHISHKSLTQWLKDGYIKKVEKPEFTKSDMIDFALYVNGLPKSMDYDYVAKDFQYWQEVKSNK